MHTTPAMIPSASAGPGSRNPAAGVIATSPATAPEIAPRTEGLPLVIHTRAASEDTLKILREEGEDGSSGSVGGVFHCFTETSEVAKAALELGFYISFSGIVTFKNAQDLRDVANFVPMDRILIETDSPYLAPAPHRGKTNDPSLVPWVAKQLAEIKGVSQQEMGQRAFENTQQLFQKIPNNIN